MILSSRVDANLNGDMYYFTGVECKHGHVSRRFTKTGVCCECVKVARKIYKSKNNDKIKERKRKAYHSDRDKHLLQRKASYQKHKAKRNAESAIYRKNNKDKLNKYYVERRKTDLNFKMSAYMRNMLNRVLSRTYNDKDNSTVQTLGYTCDELINHIESKFEDGMSWDNYGEWHIDHIVPLTVMVNAGFKDPADINHLSNLQPLWAIDNLAKSNKIE